MSDNKVILISVDGMRPDGFLSCGNPYIHDIMAQATYTLDGQTVMPSLTLPCHMSMFFSVPPQRHDVTTNTYIPMTHIINGLFEQLQNSRKSCAMYYGWEPLRDVARPGSLRYAEFIQSYADESVDTLLTDRALKRITQSHPDFVFLYMVDTDEKGGHDNGWMTPPYFSRISTAIDNIRRVLETCGDEYTVVITADHGGHGRSHGTELVEDMTIPMFYIGKDFTPGLRFSGGSIMDIAPTIVKLMNVSPAREWEGTPVVMK